MKRILIVLCCAGFFTACNQSEKQEAAAKQAAVKAVKDSLRLDSFKRAEVAEKERLAKEKEEQHKAELAAANARADANARQAAYSGGSTASRKRGWSEAAKGTAIGAGAGALGGALIDKKKGRGAIIGAAAGAGTGYLIGRSKDRKSGRVQPKN